MSAIASISQPCMINFVSQHKFQSPNRFNLQIFARQRRPVEERYKILVERNITQERAQELGVSRWRRWVSGKGSCPWDWKVDEQVYIVRGSLKVTPADTDDCAWFYGGDLVRFPKWFSALLEYDGDYEQRYRFLAYGDD